MYRLNPPAVYAHESVMGDARYRSRLERVLGALVERREPVVFADRDLPELINQQGLLAHCVPMGTLAQVPDPILLFNTFRFDEARAARVEALRAQAQVAGYHTQQALVGAEPFAWFDDRLPEPVLPTSRVCRACWRLHFQNGCAHKCHYCALGGLLVTMVNVEAYVQHLDALIRAHPWQETYLLEDDADGLCLEPELGCLGPLIEYFGTLPDRYLVLHTKSANVDWMLNLPHRGKTIIVWSLAGRSQTEQLEPGTGSLEARVAAARKCQEAGYPVRYKFKPIVPVVEWRRDATEAVELALTQTRPDVISLAVMMWMDIAEVQRRIHPALLEGSCVAAAEAAAGELAGVNARPFPHAVRAEIYRHYVAEVRRHDAAVAVSLSTETVGMWQDLTGQLGLGALNYVCGCGPNSIPGRKRLTCHPYHAAQKVGGFDRY